MLIYPAIDLRAGVCVRLLHGRFDAVTRYDLDPAARLEAFAAAGATWAHIVDLDGAEAGAPRQYDLIETMAKAASLSLQVGGGVRAADDVARLLDAGVARVVVGSAAVRSPDTVIDWLSRFGPERLALALDVRMAAGLPMVAAEGWTAATGRSLWDALDRLAPGVPRHLLVTDISRDGDLSGPNLDLCAQIVRQAGGLDFQASGGVGSVEDLRALKALGAHGAIIGRALYEGRFTLEEALDAG